jgi:hypothetical protein
MKATGPAAAASFADGAGDRAAPLGVVVTEPSSRLCAW